MLYYDANCVQNACELKHINLDLFSEIYTFNRMEMASAATPIVSVKVVRVSIALDIALVQMMSR